jgi:hypothetical protein
VPRFDLREQATRFASEISDLLNGTICNGVRITAVLLPSRNDAQLGYKLSPRQWDPVEGIPVTLGRSAPRVFLGLSYRLSADAELQYLMVVSSFMGLFEDAELEHPLLHYDYERDKGDGYPEAHLQIDAGVSHGRDFAQPGARLPVCTYL